MSAPFDAVAALLRRSVEAHAFPAAVIEVGHAAEPAWLAAFGALTYDPLAPPATPDTIFDLASLTKVLAATTLTARAVEDGRLFLDQPLAALLRGWRGADRDAVTVRHLLTHSAGLPAWLPLFQTCTGRAEFEDAISALPLDYEPDSKSIYSDLGFILLGFILEDVAPRRPDFTGAPGASDPRNGLAGQFARLATYLTDAPLTFNPPRAWRPQCAPTGIDPYRGRLLAGEVHDENCWALGGVAGHAGLFGTAAAVGAFARAIMQTLAGLPIVAAPGLMRQFATRAAIPGSSRALGWDTMLPTSSCGTLMSPSAIGHTGFTGTSLWIDAARDVYVVLLTNRVHPAREPNALRAIRPQVHDAVMRELERTGSTGFR